jgi:regulator of sirC expression with transglutaminase-like and TPR domain
VDRAVGRLIYNTDMMDLDTALETLAQDPAAPLDLAALALLLARDEYHALDVEGYLSELDGMAHEVRRYLGGSLRGRVQGLCRFLFHEMGFHGNTQHYYDARNSYLNDVIDRRTGLPITLSIVAIAVGGRAGLEIVGLGLPGHFVVKAIAGADEVIFDPFHGGRVLLPDECEHMIQQVTGQPFRLTPEQAQPTPPGLIVARMLTNLKGVYLRAEDYTRLIRVTERLRQLVPHDLSQRRDLGATLLQVGQPGRAINHLEAYLAADPSSPDAGAIRHLLQQARGRVAKWN